ncbi:MAG: peptidylprolyl isomerase [Ferruginibacter sp.]
MIKYLLYILIIVCLISCEHNASPYPHVLITTDLGEIELEIYTDKAPITANAFLLNVGKKLYKNSFFYRVLKTDDAENNINPGLIQGGVYASKITAPLIPHEPTTLSGLSHTDGVVSMARTQAGTASTEFFICIGDQSPLDAGRRGTGDSLGMAAFAKVFKGMNVVKRIQDQPNTGDAFNRNIKIFSIKKI